MLTSVEVSWRVCSVAGTVLVGLAAFAAAKTLAVALAVVGLVFRLLLLVVVIVAASRAACRCVQRLLLLWLFVSSCSVVSCVVKWVVR